MKARLYRPAKSAMSSGLAKTRTWVLEFVGEPSFKRDPLMGWNGTTNTQQQAVLHFESRDQAQAYADREGIELIVEESAHMPKKPKSYSANFSYNRRLPWTH